MTDSSSGHLARWLEGLPPEDRAAVIDALERDPDLPAQLDVILDGWPDARRDAFLQGFQSAVIDADLPAKAVLDGLKSVAAVRSDMRPPTRARRRSEGKNA